MPHNAINADTLREDEKLREIAQDLWVLRAAKKLSYRTIAKLKELPLGTVYDYITAYDEIAGDYRDDPNINRELTFIEATIEELVARREGLKKKNLKNYDAEFRAYTREIGSWIDRYYHLAGLAKPTGTGDTNIYNFFELVKRTRGEVDHIPKGRFGSGSEIPLQPGGILPRNTGDKPVAETD